MDLADTCPSVEQLKSLVSSDGLDVLLDALYERFGLPNEWSTELTKRVASITNLIGPQRGPQSEFLSSTADVAIYGGAAGSGKTFALLLDPLDELTSVEGYTAALFRQTKTDIRKPGSLWDASHRLYTHVGGTARHQYLDWTFPNGSRLAFAQLGLASDIYAWLGAELAWIGVDELPLIAEASFVFMMSRNRSTTGERPRVRATCNPDRTSWVFAWVRPWVDPECPIYGAKSGELLWFRRIPYDMGKDELGELRQWALFRDGAMLWVRKGCPYAKSITYIPARLSDNIELLKQDPEYEARLLAQDKVTRTRLLGGPEAWLITAKAGDMFKRHWWRVIERHEIPKMRRWFRVWDLAATERQISGGRRPDPTASALVGETMQGEIVVDDITEFRGRPAEVERQLKLKADRDGPTVDVVIEKERIGGQGKLLLDNYRRGVLKGRKVIPFTPTRNKVERAKPLSALAEQRRVLLVRCPKLEEFIRQAEAFPEGPYDDMVDCISTGVLHCRGTGGGGPQPSPGLPPLKVVQQLKQKHTFDEW